MDVGVVEGVEGGHPFEEAATGAEQPLDERRRPRSHRGAPQPADESLLVGPGEPGGIDGAAHEPDGALEHARGGPHGVMPVDLAEHHIAGEDHQFGRRPSLVGDRERLSRGIDAQTRQEAILVEVTAVGDAGVKAVAGEVVHLVDIDRPGEEGVEENPGRIVGRAVDEGRDPGWLEPPLGPEDRGRLPCGKDPTDE